MKATNPLEVDKKDEHDLSAGGGSDSSGTGLSVEELEGYARRKTVLPADGFILFDVGAVRQYCCGTGGKAEPALFPRNYFR